MPQFNFIGPSYTLRSYNVDCQSTINMYPDIDETQQGKSNYFLTGTPGLNKYIDISSVTDENTQIRAMIITGKGDYYVVCGYNVILITYNANTNIINQKVVGTLLTNTGYVSMADNGFQLAIVDGSNYFLYTYATTGWQQITTPGWLGSYTVTFFQSYFIFIKPNSIEFYISNSYDGTTLNPLNFASKEGLPDNLVTSLAINQTLWMFGERSIEIYYNAGGTDFPLSVMNGGFITYGCSAPFSVAIVNNLPIWLGRDQNGDGVVYMANNAYQPSRISNNAVEYFIQNLNNISDAVAYSYFQEGHYFYVLNFPSGKTTWVYDLSTNMWHERQYFNTNTAQAERHRSQFHVVWNNKHLVSDYSKKYIYDMSLDYYTDNGDNIQRIRRTPHLIDQQDLNRVFYSEFKLDVDVGSDYQVTNTNNNISQIALRYSNDGGKTWTPHLYQNLWKPGEYKKRIIWRRLGMARDRVFEVSTYDPVKCCWLNGYVLTQ